MYPNGKLSSIYSITGPLSIIDCLVPIYGATDKKLLKELLASDITRWRHEALHDVLVICSLLEDVSHRTERAKEDEMRKWVNKLIWKDKIPAPICVLDSVSQMSAVSIKGFNRSSFMRAGAAIELNHILVLTLYNIKSVLSQLFLLVKHISL